MKVNALAVLVPLLGAVACEGDEQPVAEEPDSANTEICVDAAPPGGDACFGFPGEAPGMVVSGDASVIVNGVECTCADTRMEEACAWLNFPEGCPTLQEAADVGEPWGTLWSEYKLCYDETGREFQVVNQPNLTRDRAGRYLYDSFPYLYFRTEGRKELAAVLLVPFYHGDSWCCGGTAATVRWISDEPPLGGSCKVVFMNF